MKSLSKVIAGLILVSSVTAFAYLVPGPTVPHDPQPPPYHPPPPPYHPPPQQPPYYPPPPPEQPPYYPPPPPPPPPVSYGHYTWGYGQNGNEYCYQADNWGNPLAGSSPVDNGYCGYFYAWGYAQDGNEYCYEADNSYHPLTGSSPVSNAYCQ